MTIPISHHNILSNLNISRNELLKHSPRHVKTNMVVLLHGTKKSAWKVSYILLKSRNVLENIRYLVQESCSVLLGSFVLHWNVRRVWAVQGCCQWQKDCQKREAFHPGNMFLLNLLFNFTELQLTHYTEEYKFNCYVKFWWKWSIT